jgi:hypothetical protein
MSEIEIPEVELEDPREKLQQVVDLYSSKLEDLYQTKMDIDKQIIDLAEQKAAIELVARPYVEGSDLHTTYIDQHIWGPIGEDGTFGIVQMIGELQNQLEKIDIDAEKYMFTIALYQAVLDEKELPEVPDVEGWDEELCRARPDYTWCDREDFPWAFAYERGATFMVRGRLYICHTDFNPEVMEPPEDPLEIFECIGQQQFDMYGEDAGEALVHIEKETLEALVEAYHMP